MQIKKRKLNKNLAVGLKTSSDTVKKKQFHVFNFPVKEDMKDRERKKSLRVS